MSRIELLRQLQTENCSLRNVKIVRLGEEASKATEADTLGRH